MKAFDRDRMLSVLPAGGPRPIWPLLEAFCTVADRTKLRPFFPGGGAELSILDGISADNLLPSGLWRMFASRLKPMKGFEIFVLEDFGLNDGVYKKVCIDIDFCKFSAADSAQGGRRSMLRWT